MRLKDKVALITGGAGDMGRSIARAFVVNGASVTLFDCDEELLGEAVCKLAEEGLRPRVVAGDVRKVEDLQRAVDLCEREFGKIDILVTCAGVARHMPIDEMPLESWQKVLDVNLTGTFLSCKAVAPVMKKRRYGRIVTISSLSGRTGRPCGVDYAASKAGVIGLTMCLARELAPHGITVNSVAPGPLEGRFNDYLPPEHIARMTQGALIPRLGRQEEVAHAVLYLASDEAGWVTGEVLDINGGLYV